MIDDLVFTVVSTQRRVYDAHPLVSSIVQTFQIQNLGLDTLDELGVFIVPASNHGSVDERPDAPPETDYQDLLAWGEAVLAGDESSGGLKITVERDDASVPTTYVTRQAGANVYNKIPIKSLEPGEILEFSLEVETPPGVLARRMYVDLRVDQTP